MISPSVLDLVYRRKQEVLELFESTLVAWDPEHLGKLVSVNIEAILTLYRLGIGIEERLLDEALAVEYLMLGEILGAFSIIEPERRSNKLITADKSVLVSNPTKLGSLL